MALLGPEYQVEVGVLSRERWDALQEEFLDANFYQTWAYGAVSWGESSLSHLVVRKAGVAVGIAQIRIVRIPVIGRGIAYLRWGPVCRRRDGIDPGALRVVLLAIQQEYALKRRLFVRILPNRFEQDDAGRELCELAGSLGFQFEREVAQYRTIRVDLTPTPELIRKRLDGKWRNQLNAAERNGLTVHEGTGDALYDRFVQIYEEMMARKQFDTTVDVLEFGRIQRVLPDSGKMLVLICEKDGVPMAGLTATGVGDTGIYLLGATSNEGMKFKGSYLLQWRMMQWLKERGCHWYDLGGINPDRNPGVYHFKTGFGGVDSLQCPRLRYSSDWLSTVAVTGGERARDLVKHWKQKLRARPKAEAAESPGAGASTPSKGSAEIPAKPAVETVAKPVVKVPKERAAIVSGPSEAVSPTPGKSPVNPE
jgi:lipid II:glycine glycyltransferase (peptidoglycan interpeptide bridge formation enzyme)